MSLSLGANSLAIVPLNQARFLGSGGNPPYSYSVVPGGAGGSIDGATGVYTAPIVTGIDVVKVTDLTSVSTTRQILVGTHIQLVEDILRHGMNLTDDQVYTYNQKINIPTDSRLYIAVGILSCKPFANNLKFEPDGDDLNQVQSVNMLASLSIDILSRGNQARDRKEEILMSLNSAYSQSQQTLNGFYIAPITTSFVNLSQEDGAAIPNRFNLALNMQYMMKRIVGTPYFDDFSTTDVTTEP